MKRNGTGRKHKAVRPVARILLLLVILALGIAGSGTQPTRAQSSQPAQAGKSFAPPAYEVPVYIGLIKLISEYHASDEISAMDIYWFVKGKFIIAGEYDGKNNSENGFAVMFHNPTFIKFKENVTAGEMCTALTYSADVVGHTHPVGGMNFDPKESSFTDDFKIDEIRLKHYSLMGRCEGIGEGEALIFPFLDSITSETSMMKKIKIYVKQISVAKLAGICKLPGWDEYTGGAYVYSSKCTWEAYRYTEEPEWKKKK